MPEIETPSQEPSPETPESEPSFDESFESAQSELESTEKEVTPPVESPTTETPTEPEVKVDDTDPEHIAWAKSVKGHYDPGKGFDTERLTKQAFELNKQNQSQAANLKQLQEAFQHPEIAEVFRKVYLKGETTPAPVEKPDEEKTNEEILTDFVKKALQKEIEPLQAQTTVMRTSWLQNQYDSTAAALDKEFEKYSEIKQDVNNAVAQAAVDAGVSNIALLEFLADNGKLLETFRSAARNILFPKLQEKVKTTTEVEEKVKESLEKQKRALLPGKGSPSSVIEKGDLGKVSFEDAMEAAEEELKAVS